MFAKALLVARRVVFVLSIGSSLSVSHVYAQERVEFPPMSQDALDRFRDSLENNIHL